MFGHSKEGTAQITNLDSLLHAKLNSRILEYEIKPLVGFGENYGSEIVDLKITVEENGQEKTVNAVAKLIPPTEMQREIFNTQITFKNEIGFYKDIVPTIKNFQQEHGIAPANYFAELFGARINLKADCDIVDSDGVIVMENLKNAGFINIDRQEGFNLESTKIILSTLANFQATVLAIRKKKPDLFDAKIMPYLHEWQDHALTIDLDSVITENPSTAHLLSKLKKVLVKKRLKKIRGPWATITHNDLWVNNIMVKHTDDVIDEVKFIDYQMHDYGSPAIDLIFFLFTSVQVPVLKYHFEKLLQYYFKEFTGTLLKFNVKTDEYTYDSFKEELQMESSYQIYHSLLMLSFILFGPKGGIKEPGKLPVWKPNEERHSGPSSNRVGPPKSPNFTKDVPKFKFPLNLKEKVWFIVEVAVKQHWI